MDNNYRFSYSGADIKNIAWMSIYNFENRLVTTPAVELETLSGISISVRESKGDVRSLGNRGVSGHTSSIRNIAGAMVFNFINTHPLLALIEEYRKVWETVGPYAWSADRDRNGFDYKSPYKGTYLPTALPPFNMMLIGVTELDETMNGDLSSISRAGQNVPMNQFQKLCRFSKLSLYGIELIDSGLEFSTNNIHTEKTFTFKARDYVVMEQVLANASQSDEIRRGMMTGTERLMEKDMNPGVSQEQLNQLRNLKGVSVVDRLNEEVVSGEPKAFVFSNSRSL